ncbi:NAD dependent epimerase dehydratase family protein [Lactobacillus selangorensis]|uniref:NAD dependent epimerase dehydratase family protein n=1 Tax=Lactobacillus selangorensis TaxID=81857 RepID=A0A0R2FG00_9LACO|nr:NAD-dependent epimerase/dehydratase family protein [Lactobacillus selangorensis]KRN27424.1 NAD dependent epimerase dehydratase family protein [Lactobacillus selangorensis]KRN31379.1 NAD dependent epimerase dehydratase family protein [Lactobacillus selangorensis]
MTKKVLVTGGTGYLALHIIAQLLQKGYDVRTTMRSLAKQAQIKTAMHNAGLTDLTRLSFIEADLMNDANWKEAMHDRDYVLSVAAPVFFGKITDEEQAIRPAVEGTLRILKFAQQENIKRVVMTANFGGVGFSRKATSKRPTTENDWTDENEPGLSIYEKSKLIAERKAWEFVQQPEVTFEFATVNPVAMLGPALDAHVSGSFEILTNLLKGSMKLIPDIPLNLVDVRAVADLHIRAMTMPAAAGQRFIASADGQISMPEMAAILKAARPEMARKVPTHTLPNWILKVAAPFNQQARSGLLMATMNRNVSNQKAKALLGWHPITNNAQIVLESADTLAHYNLLP